MLRERCQPIELRAAPAQKLEIGAPCHDQSAPLRINLSSTCGLGKPLESAVGVPMVYLQTAAQWPEAAMAPEITNENMVVAGGLEPPTLGL